MNKYEEWEFLTSEIISFPEGSTHSDISDKKIKKPTKGGIVEKFDLAMKKSASDRVLNQHLPSKLRRTKPEKKTVCFPDCLIFFG